MERVEERLTDHELCALFDRLFPCGFAGADVLAEIAPEGWEQSPLLACFHPSVEQIFDERLAVHRNVGRLNRLRRRSDGSPLEPPPEPTLEDVRREHVPAPVNVEEEVTELIGLCLWDIFSDNHEVIAADGRRADLGSFRSAGGFIDDYLARDEEGSRGGDYMRFYLGTTWISGRSDLAPVYAMIFRRLESIGADWEYHFPEVGVIDFGETKGDAGRSDGTYSVSESAAAELAAQRRRAAVERVSAMLQDANARAREQVMDGPPPALIRAYRQVYGRDPCGWPPA